MTLCCVFVSMQELLPLMEISERELLARHIYDELITGVLRVLSRIDLTVTRQSDQLQVITSPRMHAYTHTAVRPGGGSFCFTSFVTCNFSKNKIIIGTNVLAHVISELRRLVADL